MKMMLLVALFSMAGVAQAGEYVCKVYCNSGETYVSVNADSNAGAAAKVDQMGHQICKSDNKGNAASKTMRPEQCTRK